MTRRTVLPAAWSEAPFSVDEARDGGVSAGRLRASDLVAPFHGVRVRRGLPDRVEWICRAYQERMPGGHVFSHSTAARLYGLPLPLYVAMGEKQRDIALGIVHVAARAPLRAPEGKAVVGHRIAQSLWRAQEIVYRDPETGDLFAFPAVSPSLVWAQLAAVLDRADLVALGDAIVARAESAGTVVGGGGPLGTIESLAAMAEKWGSRSGSVALREAATSVRLGSMSRPESLCRVQLTNAGIPEPQLNARVADAHGRDIAMADLSWPRFRVLIEYEGDLHRVSAAKFRNDISRGERYADGGWRALRVTASDVFGDPNPFIDRLARALEASGWQRPSRGLRQIVGARP